MKRIIIATAVLLWGCHAAWGQQASDRDPVPMPTANTDTLMKHVRELSSEEYAGRLAGSAGYNAAAEYAARVLNGYGAKVLTGKEAQEFEVECNEVENCKFNIYRPGDKEKRVFTLGNEFCCAGMTGRGYVDGQLVFVGYGIDNKSFNEYGRVDVQGKVAVVLTGLPDNGVLPAKTLEQYATLRDKARVAQKHGAMGMIAINVSKGCRSHEPQGRGYCGTLPHLATFPVLHVTRDCATEMFRNEQMPWDSAQATIDRQKRPASFALLKKTEIDVNARYNPHAATHNVIALLEGTDKRYKNEYIMVGASLDGAGMQGETCIFPSADVNASGCAAVLEMARLLSHPDYRPKRSVLFVLFGAGEHQCMGSQEFVNNYKALRRIEAFVNVQNVGSGDSLVVLGNNRYPTLWQTAYTRDTLGERLMARTDEKTNPKGDAKAFDAIGLPSLVITTLNGLQHNHVSSDIWENIDRRMLTAATQLAAETVCELGEGLYQGRSPRSRAWR